MKYLVYTAGPITGCTYKNATSWRDGVAKDLNSDKIECLSPMRGHDKDGLIIDKGLLQGGVKDGVAAEEKSINRRDHFDCTRASCVLANFLDTKKISIGTVMEVGWAWDHQIPVVCVMEKGNVHDNHPMLNDCITYRVNTLEQAVDIIKKLFNDK
jgi:nucleoside 2-deoxyribosyltransferase